jgi:acyl-coenzyme A synthetase/AMP-(fatty) acid ligase
VALLPALDYEKALAATGDAAPSVVANEDDLYITYTGGTTGLPRVLWRQADVFFAAMGGRMPGMDAVATSRFKRAYRTAR